LENAVLDSMHTSTTESVLQWPHFDVFPSLRDDYVSIFQLEQARPAFRPACGWTTPDRPATGHYPYVPPGEVDGILGAFERTINFWYPTMSRGQLEKVAGLIAAGGLDGTGSDDPDAGQADACLAALTMALGCASQVVAGLAPGTTLSGEERRRRAARRAMADMFFDGVLRRLHVAHTDVSSTSTHCLFFVA
jgi:hypothetical protein